MKKLFPLFALFASFLYAVDYLVDGVDLNDESTYYDFDKVFDGTDNDLCWAYSVANVLQWWQDKQDASYISYYSIPDGTTADAKYKSNIVSTFVAAWANEGGAEIDGFSWWLSDVAGSEIIHPLDDDDDEDDDEIRYFPDGGGYWSEFVSTTTYIGEQIEIEDVAAENKYAQYFIEVMNEAIFDGCGLTLGIYTTYGDDPTYGDAHAITLWGYGTDDEGNYWLYVTDSDDWKDGVYGMVTVDIEYNEDKGLWYLQGYSGSTDTWNVGSITVFTAGVLTVPEPATSLLSLMALAGLLARRRRKVA